MGTATSVQFRSPESLLEMYDMVKIPSWSISQRSQLLHSYSGSSLEQGRAELSAFLDMLIDNESAAIYTLRLHKKVKANGDIDNRTPYNGSYNFNFTDTIVGSVPGNLPARYGGNGIQLAKDHYELKDRVEQLEDRLDQIIELLSAKHQEQPVQESVGSVLMASLMPVIPDIVSKVIDGFLNGKPGNQPTNDANGQINGLLIEAGNEMSADEYARCLELCDQLRPLVGDVPAALEKLIRYGKKNPIAFKTYLKML